MVPSSSLMRALTTGCALSAWAAALTKKGIGDSLTPSRARKSSLACARSRMTRVTSTSTTVVSWACVCRAFTMLSPMTLRIRVIFTVWPRSGDTASAGFGAAPALAAGGADLGRLVLLDQDLQQGARHGRGDLGVDLVGGHLQQRLVGLDALADRLEPAGDGALGDALAECGQRHVGAGRAAGGGGRRGGLGRSRSFGDRRGGLGGGRRGSGLGLGGRCRRG